MAKRRGTKEGSIFQRSNGSWRAQVTIDGKRLSFTGNTQKQCREWIREITRRIDQGLSYEAAKVQYGEYLQNWLSSSQNRLRTKTWEQYRQLVRDYIVPTIGNVKLSEISTGRIQSLYDQLIKDGRGLRTVQLVHAVIHSSLEQAVRLGVLTRNPDNATHPPKPKKKEMGFLNETQVQQLLIVVQEMQERNLALYQLDVSTGMRQGEMLGLKWEDIAWQAGQIQVKRQLKRINGKGFEFAQPKTKAGIRSIAIGKQIIESLRKHEMLVRGERQENGNSWQEHDLVFPNKFGKPLNAR